MIRRALPIAACALALLIGACDSGAGPESPAAAVPVANPYAKKVVSGAYVVVFRTTVPAEQIGSVAAELAAKHKGTIDQVFTRAIRGFSVTMSATAAAGLAQDARVLRVEQDVVTMARPKEGKSKGKGKGQEVSYGLTRVGGSHDGTGRRAWIIDSGIDFDHPDLNVDESLSVSFVTSDKKLEDANGHGTHVAGIIGAKDNATGTVGVAANATLVSVKVLDRKGDGQASWIIAGVEHVLANASAGDVVNMSLGGGLIPSLDDAVMRLAEAGVKVVIAAGNDGADCSFTSPARVTHPNVYTVSAVDESDVFWSFSNYGYGIVDVAAPGVDILSSKRGGGVTSMSGTSMATPHVAGLLLAGSLRSDGRTAIGDLDGQPDPVAIY